MITHIYTFNGDIFLQKADLETHRFLVPVPVEVVLEAVDGGRHPDPVLETVPVTTHSLAKLVPPKL